MIIVDDVEGGGLNIEYSATGERKKVAIGMASAIVGNPEFQKMFLEALMNVISNANIDMEMQEKGKLL